MINDTAETDLNQFIEMATNEEMTEQGIACYELATLVCDNAAYLTEPLLRGFVTFLAIAKVDPERAADLIGEEV